MSGDEIEEMLGSALSQVKHEDADLLQHDVNERSLTHRLAMYLEEEIGEDWDVDVEYNRIGNHGFDPKRFSEGGFIDDIPSCSPRDIAGKTVYPDVIIHKRGEDQNLLVIEAKKAGNQADYDYDKLNAYMRDLEYEYGAYVEFTTGSADCGNKITYKLRPRGEDFG